MIRIGKERRRNERSGWEAIRWGRELAGYENRCIGSETIGFDARRMGKAKNINDGKRGEREQKRN